MSGQTGRIVGMIAGAALAYFTGGASYVALGATLGGAVGSLLDPAQKVEGPRLDDLKVQFSSYGVGIPMLYGTERVGGNVIWSTDKLEISSTTSAGKGGGGVENTSYRYYVHMSMILCETPRDGSTVSILKFFQDGKLIWDASSGIAIGSALASAENPYAAFVLYQGWQDQLPDPIEESWTGGPGTCSAYRGVVRIRMIAIECPGGRVPQFSFVLSNGATVGQTKQVFCTFPSTVLTAWVDAEAAYGIYQLPVTSGVPATLEVWRGDATGVSLFNRMSLPADSTVHAYPAVINGTSKPMAMRTRYNGFEPWPFTFDLIDLIEGTTTTLNVYNAFSPNLPYSAPISAAYDPISDRYVMIGGSGAFELRPYVMTTTGLGTFCSALPEAYASLAFYDSTVYAVTCTAGGLFQVHLLNAETGLITTSINGPTFFGSVSNAQGSMIRATADGIFVYADTSPGLTPGGRIYRIDVATSTWVLVSADADTLTGTKNQSGALTLFYTDGKVAIVGPSSDTRAYTFLRMGVVQPVSVKAKTIIADQWSRAGSTVDVTALPDSDLVYGYKLAGPASARANIEPVLTAFGYFVVDEDGTSKVKRYADVASVASVSFDELGQAEGGDPSEAMPLNRTQEIDLARSVTVSYIQPLSDFQTAAETEVRQVTSATEDVQIQLPIAIASDQARKVAQMALYDRWRRQNSRSMTVSRKFAFVSPGDGVTVEYPRGTFKLWLVLSTNDTGAVCEWTLVPGDASIFTQTATGATGYSGQQVAALPGPTRLQILDIPILRDVDNNASLYAALDGYADGWSGAELYSGDDDTNLVSRGTVSADAPIGIAETVIPAASGTMTDEASIFTVSLGDDAFVGCTRDVLLAGGGEFWACGRPGRWEIGASSTGSSLGSGRYILSQHLRGLFGTEANAALHQAGDAFVLLRPAGLLRPSMAVGDIGQARSYRAVSKGRTVDSVSSTVYANTGEGLTPLSPVNLRRTNTNDLTVDRRSRLSMNFSTGALPLGETAEGWSWSFYTTSGYTALIGTVVTNTATVTAAQMTTAGVTPTATVYVRVAQLSDSIGKGHELQASA